MSDPIPGIRERSDQGYADHGLAHAADDVEVLLDLLDTIIGRRQPYHVLEVDEAGWALQHQAGCFPDLLACPVHIATSRVMRALDEEGTSLPPPGRYRLTDEGYIAVDHATGYVVEVGADG